MKFILLDTSFILSCIRKKIDFFEELNVKGYEIIIPKQVLLEIKGLSKSGGEAKLALKLLDKNKFKKLDLETSNTDKGIVKYANYNDVIVGTLDKWIKDNIRGNKLVIRGKKRLEIV